GRGVGWLGREGGGRKRAARGGVRGFFRSHACLPDPGDGPAGLVFSDGRRVGAALDRNGLRPLRWQVCEDGLVVCASEVGAVPVSGRGTVHRGRLGPGDMICVDPDRIAGGNGDAPLAAVQDDTTVKTWLARPQPYSTWARDGPLPADIGSPVEMPPDPDDLVRQQVAFGLTREEVAMVLKPMATDAKEPTFSMGDDVPFAAVATRARPMFNYLKQRFAQVTNPPIDHLRERLVMSLRTCLGARRPLLTEEPGAARLLELPSFFLYPSAVEALLDSESVFKAVRLDATFPVADGPGGLGPAIRKLADAAAEAGADGASSLLVPDRSVGPHTARTPRRLALCARH